MLATGGPRMGVGGSDRPSTNQCKTPNCSIVQNYVKQRAVDFETAVVVDEA